MKHKSYKNDIYEVQKLFLSIVLKNSQHWAARVFSNTTFFTSRKEHPQGHYDKNPMHFLKKIS